MDTDYRKQFEDDLKRSQTVEVESFWWSSHSQAFKGFQSSSLVTDLDRQLEGIDRDVFLEERTVTIEEKTDFTTYPNMALEVESTKGYSKGWIEKDLRSDILAYGFINHSPPTVYYFLTSDLLNIWQDNKVDWQKKYGNRTVYCSKAIVCPVPIEEILKHTTYSKVVTLR